MKLSKLITSRPSEITVDVLGESVTLVYDRALINGAFWKSDALWRDRLARLLISWDITDEHTGKPVMPPESANGSRAKEWAVLFEPIADDVLLPMYEAIFEDYRPGPKLKAGSSDT
jgi:hypothetical protein